MTKYAFATKTIKDLKSIAMKLWEKQIGPQDLDEKYAWIIFRYIRWKDSPPLCIYCQSPVGINSKRKGKHQYFYKCSSCKKNFTDLTDTPFNKTRLLMRQILFMTVLIRGGIPINRICKIMRISNATGFRHHKAIKKSERCKKLSECLSVMSITTDSVLNHLAPNLASKMKYRKWYCPKPEEKSTSEKNTNFYNPLNFQSFCIHGISGGCRICFS